jgi:F420-0:gamma-glutamyl ligase-like protein
MSNFTKIKNLLATKQQGFGRLAISEECLCFLGVLALSLGGKVVTEVPGYTLIEMPDRQRIAETLSSSHYKELGLDSFALVRDVEKLSYLTETQLNKLGYCYCVSWDVLNDTLRLTFSQFSELLGIIEAKINK